MYILHIVHVKCNEEVNTVTDKIKLSVRGCPGTIISNATVRLMIFWGSFFVGKGELERTMKKRLTKVLAMGLTAAMLAGAPLSAMAAEVTPADTAVTNEAVTEEDAQAVTDENAEEAVAEENADDGIDVTALTNGVDPMTLNGLVQLNDGNWYYMEDGKLSSNADRTVKPACGSWWYVEQLKINFSFKGFGKNGDDLWYVENGQVQFGYTGIATGTNPYGPNTCYVTNGRVDNSFNGLCYGTVYGKEGWYNFKNGKVNGAYQQLVEYNGAWWYVKNGRVDFSYTGAVFDAPDVWYVRNGQIDFSYTGMIEGRNKSGSPYQYYFVNGKTNESLTGVFYTTVNGVEGWYGFYQGRLSTDRNAENEYKLPGRVLPNEAGWWYIDPDTGMVDFNYNGLGITQDDHGYYSWYVENGQINFNYNGMYRYYDSDAEIWTLCYITNGQVNKNINGVYQYTVDGQTDWYGLRRGKQVRDEQVLMNPYDGSWWYVGDDGLVDFSCTGICERLDERGREAADHWYVKNGQVDFSSNGWIKINSYFWAYIENGKEREDLNGLVQATIDGEDGWWKVKAGHIYFDEDRDNGYSLAYYGGSWWAVNIGTSRVDFSYTGLAKNEDTVWYVENGRVNFDKTGFIKTNKADSYAYIQNGQYNNKFTGLVYADLNGKTSWWQVKNGNCKHSADAEWSGTPDSYAMNESGLWAIVNGEVAFDVTGVYQVSERYELARTLVVNYTYNVVNGLVTDMQITLSEYPH